MAAATVTQLKKKQEEKQGFNLDDLLESAAKPETSKSSSKVPVLTVDEKVQKKVQRYEEVVTEIDNLTAEKDLLNAEITGDVDPLRAAYIRKFGFTLSVKIPDGNGKVATVGYSTRYSKVPVSSKPVIEEKIGEDRFSNLFTRKMEITVKDVSEENLKEIVAAVGPDKFAQYFSVDRWYEPTERYTKEGYSLFTDEERADLATVVKPYKASIRVK